MPARRRRRLRGYRPKGTYANLCAGEMPPIGEMRFSGKTYNWQLDQYRLGTQMNNVWQYFKDGEWHYPPELEENVPHATGREDKHYNWCSISARVRDFRKDRFGAHNVESKRVRDGGSWKYRLVRE